MADDTREDEDDSPLHPGEILDETYEIQGELGRGGIGVVYKALDLELGLPVAIKLLLDKWARDRKMVARFLREGRAAIRAKHPNIVQILGIRRRKSSGAPYIVMEFVEGEVLQKRLVAARERGAKVGVAGMPIIWQLSRVLAGAHARGIVHRDLKPANIMLVSDEGMIGGHQVKILDFGIAKIFNESDGDGTQTSAGEQQPGTPAYMPPEQFKPLNKDGDPGKMDVYALGVIAYQMLAGRLPLWNSDRFVLTMMVMTADPEPLGKLDPSLPASLTALVAQMLAKDPAERPTMDQVRAQLATYLGLRQSRTDVVTIRPTTEINAIMPLATGDVAAVSTEDTPPVGQSSASATPSLGVMQGRARPQHEPEGGHLSSGAARGTTGQQVTGAEARARRQSGRLLLLGGAGSVVMVGLVVAVLSVSSRSAVVPPPPLAPVSAAAPAVATTPPALVVVPIGTPTSAEPAAAAVEAPAPRPGRARASCSAVAPTEACIAGQLSAVDRRAFLSALDEADVRLCANDHLTVVGKPSLMVTSAGGVRKSKQEHFVLALRGSLRTIAFPGEVVIRCKTK